MKHHFTSNTRALAVGLVAALAATVAAAGPVAVAASPGDNDVIVLSVEPGKLDRASFSKLLADFDVLDEAGQATNILGDAQTAASLTAAGASVVKTQTYGETIAAATPAAKAGSLTPRSLRTAAVDRNYPVPSRLGDTEYPTYYGGYRTVAGYEAFLQDVATAYPELVQLVDYGNSFEKVRNPARGHDLLAVRVTAGANADGDWRDHSNRKPRFYLTGQAHAREIITSELTWRLIAQLLDGYGTDAEITDLLDSTELWIAPQNNPDGVELVEEGLSDPNLRYSAAGDANPVNTSKAWQRKNTNDTLFAPTSTNWNSQQPGVDLNRNFATAFGGASTSSNPNSTTYKGEAPFSEPETRYQSELLTQLFGRYKVGTTTAAPDTREGVFVNLHSAAGLVIYPYAYDWQANVPNLDAIAALGFRQGYYNRHDTGKAGEILYNNAGNDIDWVYDELGIPAFTWEIGSSATGSFFPNYSRVEAFWALQGPALIYSAKVAGSPYTTPSGPSVVGWNAAHNSDGTVKISGTASDNLFGDSSGSRRPATQAVTDVEAVVGPVSAPLAGPVSLTVSGTSDTATFHGAIPVSDAIAGQAQVVRVRAQDSSGAWGPWYAVNLRARAAGPGSEFENIVLDVNPGVLTLSVPIDNTVTLAPATLNGEDQTVTANLVPVSVNNGRGTSAGWTLSGQAGTFAGDNGTSLSAANLGWAPTASVVAGSYTPPAGVPASTVNAGSTIAPQQNNTGLSAPRTLASSPSGASAGKFTAGGRLTLGIPANTKAGRYTSLLTLTLQ